LAVAVAPMVRRLVVVAAVVLLKELLMLFPVKLLQLSLSVGLEELLVTVLF
jgi:hypothetical protein